MLCRSLAFNMRVRFKIFEQTKISRHFYQTGKLNSVHIFLVPKLYETCLPNIWTPKTAPEYQAIESSRAVDI